MPKEMLTQARLKELLHYDPDAGILRWKKRPVGLFKKTLIAGHNRKDGYLIVGIDSNLYLGHRIAFSLMTGGFPEEDIDHINGDPSDNRWCNLRPVSRSINLRNQKLSVANKSGISGVHLLKGRDTWVSYIKVHQKRIHIGYFDNIFDAACARKSAEIIHGFSPNHGRR